MADKGQRSYIAIDLKSFYASVECKERELDPMTTNLVVADKSRTEKTICLAVSPSLKSYGIPGRARLFEVVQKVKEVNKRRICMAPGKKFAGASVDKKLGVSSRGRIFEIDPKIEYMITPPRMHLYMEYSCRVFKIFLEFIAKEDIHVYSIDEVFMDVTDYLNTYRMTARELAGKIIREIQQETSIAATAGIGTNLYLCKVAMDIVAKHIEPDQNGVRIAELTEISYRKLLWAHQPITDFWRVGQGYAKKLAEVGLFTMGDVARCSLGKPGEYYNEDLLYRLFGVNAELLIDHAWGWEPCTIADVKAYKPENNSMGAGQVLHCPYNFEQTKIVVKEMIDQLALDLVDKRLVTDQIVLTIGYDIKNLEQGTKKNVGEITTDWYGRKLPKHAHGTANLKQHTSSSRLMTQAVVKLYNEIVNPDLLIRRITMAANHVISEKEVKEEQQYEQMNLFTDFGIAKKEKEEKNEKLEREKKMQKAMLDIKKKYGKNAILKGMNLQEDGTAMERNRQIGGHKA